MQVHHQHLLFAFADELHRRGLRHVVLCPGNRNVPLIVAFARHGGFQLHSAPDERSAAFKALGMAWQTGNIAAVCTTSGTAATNLYPAITEAYYSGIPLLAITADRPQHLINNWDGQTIRQNGLFSNHILAEYTLQPSVHFRNGNTGPDKAQMAQEGSLLARTAWATATLGIKGPVHVNVPIEEPLYPDCDQPFENADPLKDLPFDAEQWAASIRKDAPFHPAMKTLDMQTALDMALPLAAHPLILCGADPFESPAPFPWEICGRWPVIADIQSAHRHYSLLPYADSLLGNAAYRSQIPAPQLLITLGSWVLGKNTKQFLRNNPPKLHIHLSPQGQVADPFSSHPHCVECDPAQFLKQLYQRAANHRSDLEQWTCAHQTFEKSFAGFAGKQGWNEFHAMGYLLSRIPADSVLHIGSSMPIRYAGIMQKLIDQRIRIQSNRGTSGIDGATSTAVGAALADPEHLHFLITGDIAFLYDINAFWGDMLPPNLKVILMNNRGGNIFRMIDGPASLPELNWLNTPHHYDASNLSRHFGLNYSTASATDELNEGFSCLHSEGCSLLEVFTDPVQDAQAFADYRRIQ